MIVNIRHTTKYHYEHRAEAAAYLLHLCPRALPWQDVQSFALRTTGDWREATDHFGNPVVHLSLQEAHDAIEIVADLAVLIEPRPRAPKPEVTPQWERVAAEAQLHPEIAEFAFASALTRTGPALRDWVRASFPPGRAILAGVSDLMARLEGDGACVAVAHRMLAGLRALGLPCRFVSGFLRTEPPPGTIRLRGADKVHAWISCWLGPDWGWIDLDPASGGTPGEGYVWLAWGRDYADVAPVRGVQCGGGSHTMSVSVDMERPAVPQALHPVPLQALAQ